MALLIRELFKVMTTVYGVTYVGARAQIEKQLRDRADMEREHIWAASSYLAKHVCLLTFSLYACQPDRSHRLLGAFPICLLVPKGFRTGFMTLLV